MRKWVLQTSAILCLMVEGPARADVVTNSYCVAQDHSSVTCNGIRFEVDISNPKAMQTVTAYLDQRIDELRQKNNESAEDAVRELQARWSDEKFQPLLQRVQTLEEAGNMDAREHDAKLDDIQKQLDVLLSLDPKEKLKPKGPAGGALDIGLEYTAFLQGSRYARGTGGIVAHVDVPFLQKAPFFAIDGAIQLALDDKIGVTYDWRTGLLIGAFGHPFGFGFGLNIGLDGVNIAGSAPDVHVPTAFYVAPAALVDVPLADTVRIYADARLAVRTATSPEVRANLGFLFGKWIDDGPSSSSLWGVCVYVGYRSFTNIDISGYSAEIGFRVSGY